MSSQPPHQRARPGARHPFAASAPSAPLAQPQPVPSTPPPSYTPKDPFAPDDRVSSQYQTQGIPQPLTAVPTSSRPPSRRCSNPANAAVPAFSTPESHQQQATAQVHARRRSSAAARVAAASAPDLSRTLSREDPSLDMNGIPQSNSIEQLDSPNAEPPSSALHPRIAVVLGINESFHVPLLLCRPECGSEVASLVITEVGLAALWCTASGYLSFYFADCLMSRWLLNYTPAATLVRLFTISAINVYTTSWWLHLSGASSDPRLLLPAWICIASMLTILYHLAHRHVNIRRETRAAVRAFYVSSSVSLFLLLLQSHLERGTWRVAPLVGIVERVARAWSDARVPTAGGGGEL
ncbi:N-glycosylation protein eos1 [Lasiodiplodia theobromae]|uniref:N-glycosylation protein eos1 n=1 Tax=Lasiodiplodia theobromae TaxID=45133 RepID=A0A5N5CWI5_9PEZI|nr:N-glycosylation protein eos1 [Lasiodiplodia theobromae]